MKITLRHPLAMWATVTLNGHALRYCTFADTARGVVNCYAVDPLFSDGRLLVHGNHLAREVRRGDVRVRFADVPRELEWLVRACGVHATYADA